MFGLRCCDIFHAEMIGIKYSCNGWYTSFFREMTELHKVNAAKSTEVQVSMRTCVLETSSEHTHQEDIWQEFFLFIGSDT